MKPLTLFVNKARIASDAHAPLTWGAAQAGVAGGVIDAVAEGILAEGDLIGVVLVCAVWVDPAARDAALVCANNRQATLDALRAGAVGSRPLRTCWRPGTRSGTRSSGHRSGSAGRQRTREDCRSGLPRCNGHVVVDVATPVGERQQDRTRVGARA